MSRRDFPVQNDRYNLLQRARLRSDHRPCKQCCESFHLRVRKPMQWELPMLNAETSSCPVKSTVTLALRKKHVVQILKTTQPCQEKNHMIYPECLMCWMQIRKWNHQRGKELKTKIQRKKQTIQKKHQKEYKNNVWDKTMATPKNKQYKPKSYSSLMLSQKLFSWSVCVLFFWLLGILLYSFLLVLQSLYLKHCLFGLFCVSQYAL